MCVGLGRDLLGEAGTLKAQAVFTAAHVTYYLINSARTSGTSRKLRILSQAAKKPPSRHTTLSGCCFRKVRCAPFTEPQHTG